MVELTINGSSFRLSNLCNLLANSTSQQAASPAFLVRDVLIFFFDIVGLFGNVLSCIVIKRYLLHSSATYVLFLFLAIADSLAMIMVTIETVRHRYASLLMPKSTASCGVYGFFYHFSFEFSAVVIMALTIDRYLTIRAPFAHRERSKYVRRGWIVGMTIFLVLTLFNSHYFFTRELQTTMNLGCEDSPAVESCHFRFEGPTADIMLRVTTFLHGFFYCYIPYIVTFVFNIILLLRLFVARNYQQSRRITAMLLLVTFSFIILTLPHAVYTVLVNEINASKHRNFRLLTRDISRVLIVINHSLNFVFYMTGKQFRMATRRLLCHSWDRRQRRKNSQKYAIATFVRKERDSSSETRQSYI